MDPNTYPPNFQPVTRGECLATQRQIMGSVGNLKDAIKGAANQIEKATGKIEKVSSDVSEVAKKQAEDRAWRMGQELAEAKGRKVGASKVANLAMVAKWAAILITVGSILVSATVYLTRKPQSVDQIDLEQAIEKAIQRATNPRHGSLEPQRKDDPA